MKVKIEHAGQGYYVLRLIPESAQEDRKLSRILEKGEGRAAVFTTDSRGNYDGDNPNNVPAPADTDPSDIVLAIEIYPKEGK